MENLIDSQGCQSQCKLTDGCTGIEYHASCFATSLGWRVEGLELRFQSLGFSEAVCPEFVGLPYGLPAADKKPLKPSTLHRKC